MRSRTDASDHAGNNRPLTIRQAFLGGLIFKRPANPVTSTASPLGIDVPHGNSWRRRNSCSAARAATPVVERSRVVSPNILLPVRQEDAGRSYFGAGDGGSWIGLSASFAPESRHRLDAIVPFPAVPYNAGAIGPMHTLSRPIVVEHISDSGWRRVSHVNNGSKGRLDGRELSTLSLCPDGQRDAEGMHGLNRPP